jgi:hypothetical protein
VGDAVATWTAAPPREPDAPSAVYAATRSGESQRWRPPERVSTAGRVALSVVVEMSPTGRAVLVWTDVRTGDEDTALSCAVWSRTFDVAARVWGSPTRIGEACDNPGALQLGMDQFGIATAIWVQAGRVVAATRRGGGWSKPRLISTIPRYPEAPLLAVGEGGDAVVLFSRICIHVTPACRAADADLSGLGASLPRVLESTIRLTPHTWEPAQQIAAGDDLYPVIRDVAIDGAGHATAIWAKGDGVDADLMASTRRTSRWERPQTLSTPGLSPLVLEDASGDGAVRVDEAGNAIAVWVGYRAKAGSVVVARSLRARGTSNWASPRVTVDFGTITFPSIALAIGRSGTVAAVWSGSAPDGRGVAAQLGKLPTDQWESISRHAAPRRGYADLAAVAVRDTGAGAATILWTTSSAADIERLHAFSLER